MESEFLRPSIDEAATSSLVADNCEILSEITLENFTISLVTDSVVDIPLISSSISFTTCSNLSLVISISLF